jgi:ubiquinone/menaquinone biosynthesis C-methylase UbiE
MTMQRHRDRKPSPVCDQILLRDRAYADDAHLDVRYRTHQLYTVEPVDFGKWTLEKISWDGVERILDAGCGPGDLLRALARSGTGQLRIGFDLSPGMATEASDAISSRAVAFFVADIQAIPFPSSSFEVVMARHMLYHVPNMEQGISDAARVLRPGGQFLATTNSAQTMPQYRAILRQAQSHFPAIAVPGATSSRFNLENAPQLLEPHFQQIEQHTLTGTLRFPSAQPFVAYFASSRDLIMHPDHTEMEWQAVLDFVQTTAEEIIAGQGCLDITKVTGAITGRKGG